MLANAITFIIITSVVIFTTVLVCTPGGGGEKRMAHLIYLVRPISFI